MTATEYNDKVWDSTEMLATRQALENAQNELAEESRGWGTMPLEAAREHLVAAMNNVQTMLNWANELADKQSHTRSALVKRPGCVDEVME